MWLPDFMRNFLALHRPNRHVDMLARERAHTYIRDEAYVRLMDRMRALDEQLKKAHEERGK